MIGRKWDWHDPPWLSGTDLIPQAKLLFGEFHASPQTFCDTKPFVVELARELQADTAQPRIAF